MDGGAIILAGGQSQRMKRNKALLELGQQKFIENIADKLVPPCKNIIISTNNPEEYRFLGYKMVADELPQRGPLSGIHAALKASDYAYNFIVPCDMPFLNRELVKFILEESRGFDVTIPKLGEYIEPLYGVYHKNCIEAIEKQLLEGQKKKVSDFYPQIKVKYIGERELAGFGDLEKIFYNVNTPEELKGAQKLFEKPFE